MSMSVKDWQDLASVYRAGAGRARGWVFNNDRQQDADILEAQADRCEEIARERDGKPLISHEHYHTHASPDGKDQISHWHPHEHAAGETGHDHAHPPGTDPFAPPEPLFPES